MAGWFRPEPMPRGTATEAPAGRPAWALARRRTCPDRLRARRSAGTNSDRRGRARRARRSIFHAASGRTRRGAALDTCGEFAADAFRGDGRDQVAAAGQGHRPVREVTPGRSTAGREVAGVTTASRGRGQAAGGGSLVERAPFDLGACPRVRARQRTGDARGACVPARCCPSAGRSSCRRSVLPTMYVRVAIDCGRDERRRRRARRSASELARGRVGRRSAVRGAAGRHGAGRPRGVLGGASARARRGAAFSRACSRRRSTASAAACTSARRSARGGRGREPGRRVDRFGSRQWSRRGWLRLTAPRGDGLPGASGGRGRLARAGGAGAGRRRHIEIARTGVPVPARSRRSRVGDAVVFDGRAARRLRRDAAWPGRRA